MVRIIMGISLVTTVSLGIGLARAPGSSAAQSPVLLSGPVRVRGYQLTLAAGAADRPGRGSVVQLELYRRGARGSHQSHDFTVREGVAFRVAHDLRSAHLRASLPGYGRVELTVTGATARRRGGCYAKLHKGIARGTLKFTPGGSYFGRIVRTRLPVRLAVQQGCAGRHRTARVPEPIPFLLSSGRGPAHVLLGASSDLSATLFRPGSRVRVEDAVEVPELPASNLLAAPDLSSATLRAVGSFFAGEATYRATTALRPMGPELRHTTGTLSGTLQVLFDTPGPVALTGSSFQAELTG